MKAKAWRVTEFNFPWGGKASRGKGGWTGDLRSSKQELSAERGTINENMVTYKKLNFGGSYPTPEGQFRPFHRQYANKGGKTRRGTRPYRPGFGKLLQRGKVEGGKAFEWLIYGRTKGGQKTGAVADSKKETKKNERR